MLTLKNLDKHLVLLVFCLVKSLRNETRVSLYIWFWILLKGNLETGKITTNNRVCHKFSVKYINWHQSIAPWIVLTQCLISGCLAIIIFDLRLFSNNKPAKLQSCCQGDPTQRSRECGLATLLVMMMMKSGLGCIPILSTLIFIFEVPNHCPLHWKKTGWGKMVRYILSDSRIFTWRWH